MNPKRILIAEDNQDHRIILRHQLPRIGTFAILEATNGQEAVDIVAREAVDLIILNLRMPVLDGWEAARRIRALPSPAGDVPIIAFTAYAGAGSEQRARAAGCDEYMVKPVLDFTTMKDKVEQLLTYGRAVRP
jgi:two-component system, cell cycle response regulator DivK